MSNTTTLNEVTRSPVDYTEYVRLATPGVNWKAQLSSFVRRLLTSATAFYVSATGSDSNPGTSLLPWATLQHAVDYISSQVDTGGQLITVNVGAGSFAGFGMKPCAGGGKLWFNGAGAGSTSITGGPADFVYNIGECISAYVATHIDWWIGNLTVDGSALPSFAAPINLIAYNQLFRGDPTSATAPTIEHIANPATYHVTIFDFSGFGDNPLQNPSVTLSGDCSGYVSAQSFSGASLNAAHTILGNPTWSDKFLKLDEIALVSTGNSTFTGSATGNQGSVTLNSVLNTAGAGTSYLPGTANTVTTATGGQYL